MVKRSLIIIALILTNLFGQQMKKNLIPTPQKIDVNYSLEKFDYSKNMVISFNQPEVRKHKIIKEKLNDIFSSSSLDIIFDKNEESTIDFKLIDSFESSYLIPNNFEEEAYILIITNNNILVEAKTLKGIYYSILTLAQLVEESENNLPQLKIVDYPDMKFRGISDDFSRGQVSTTENFKRIIKFISESKMNTYMPYMEDVIEFDSFPQIGVGRGALSKNEIREIVKFADEHFVDIIPIFQTLGHYENILSLPDFINYADFPGAASLDVTNPETYIFLEKMLKEVFELFPSKYFHIGADESYDIGLGKSRKLVEQSDMATVHANHYQKVYNICKENNKEVMMYGDIILSHPEILEKIPKDIIIVDWHYFPKYDYPSTKVFKDSEFNYIVSPSVWNFNSAFPENFFAVPNIKTITESGIRNSSIGMINSSWGDYGAETFREFNLYGYMWSAQCSWNIEDSKINNFNDAYFTQFFKIDPTLAKEIYEEFNLLTNQIVWNNFWRHPLLDYRIADWRQYNLPQSGKYYSMKLHSDLSEKIISLKKHAKRNRDFIDLLDFSAELKNWFLLKQETQIYLHEILDSNFHNKDHVLNLITENIDKLKLLKSEYSRLWKKYNREDNLWMINDKFERMITYFLEIKYGIENKSLTSPFLQSEWIYYPEKESEFISEVEFVTNLKIESEIESAKLQLIGDTFAKLIINGKEIDSVFTKRSGSLWIEQIRVKYIDVKKFLKVGENKIEVLAKNFYDKKMPGINIISEIKTKIQHIEFKTDKNWKVKKINSGELFNVEEKENSLEIIAPNFKTNRKSWIER